MAADLQAIAGLLQASLNPSQNREAEASLKQEEQKPGFSLTLLQIVDNNSFSDQTRLASALFFKNFVRRNWADENGEHKLPQEEVRTIKSELIGLMVKVPSTIQAQLGDAISVIAESDFFERWDTLVDDLVSRLTPDNAQQNNGVLQVAHSIFKRWEPLFRTDDLFTEINHVLSRFARPFLQLWQTTDQLITQNESNVNVLKAQFSTLDLLVKLFYDLSTQDLPPDFEDNLSAISALLHKYLTHDNAALHTSDDDEAGVQEHVRAGIFRVLVLYTKKYEDAFGPHLGQFISSSWNMLTNIGPELKYDLMVSRALEFLTTVTSIRTHAENFNNADVLGQVTEKVVLPNLSLRESDIELFEDEPIEFIRRDLEGSDEDTRRRAATNFLKKLMEQFEKLVTEVVMKYVTHFLAEYAKDKKGNWKSKDTAVHLYSSIAAKGVATSARGVLSVNPNTNVISFFQDNIAEDLTNSESELLLKVDAIKYLYIFRSILSPEQWQAAFPLLVQHLNSSNYVVYTYAAIAVDRALYLTNEQTKQPVISRESITPLSKDLLQHLFKLITKDSKPEKVQENEFLMKCVMRVLIVIRDGILQVLDLVLTNLVNITRVIRHNPSNPGFCYYHFESLGALVRFAGPSQSEKIESSLFPVFMEVLSSPIDDFNPYLFQIFAAMVAAGSGPLSTRMQQLVTPILTLSMWDSKGNVPALTRLLCNMLPRGATQIAEANQTEAILIIFQKLISSKAYESHAMDLIEKVVTSFPVTALQSYWQPMLQLMFTKLSSNPTENFTLRFVKFYHLVSANVDKGLGADFFIGIADRVQQNVFTPIYTTIILPNTQKLSRPMDRKTAVISLTRTLADSQEFAVRYSNRGWTLTCEALLKLLINPPLPAAVDDVIEDRDTEDLGFGAAFTPLQTCRTPPTDPFPQVRDVKQWVGAELKAADQRHAGRISTFVGEKLDDQGKGALMQVMAAG